MRRYQLHLYLTEILMALLKDKAAKMGLTPSQYVKFILVNDLGAHPVNLNIRSSPKEIIVRPNGKIEVKEQEIY